MNEESIIEERKFNNIEINSDDQGTHVMPFLLSTTQSQLTAIINPISSPIVTNQSKVFIQSSTPSNAPQNKQQHIVIKHPISSVNTAPQNQHILLRKPNTSNAQIVPLNTSTAVTSAQSGGQHTFAYLGTVMKPNNAREFVKIPGGTTGVHQSIESNGFVAIPRGISPADALQKPKETKQFMNITFPQGIIPANPIQKPKETKGFVAIPRGTVTANPLQKPKLVIGPMIPGIGQSSSCAIPVGQAQPLANFLLPVTISQPPVSTEQSTVNLQFGNGQVGADSNGTVTVLRESKSTNASSYPPPLHPLTKMSLLAVNNPPSTPSESIKISENPDSAVITPIPKKDESPLQKRQKTVSNILRGSTEKRPKKQTFPKSQESMDISYSVSSPEGDQDNSKKSQNDDEITLIKVVQGEDKIRRKSSVDDDVKIEMIKTSTSSGAESSEKLGKVGKNCDDIKDVSKGNHQNDPNFDAAKALDWKDGVGSLPGSSLKFRINEFGMMEVVDDEDNTKQPKHNIGDKENVCLSRNSSKSSSVGSNNDKKNEEKKTRQSVSADTLYCCESCGCYGMAAEFESPISCSPACTEVIAMKKQISSKKEKEARELRAKRKRKKMMMQEQNLKEPEVKIEVEVPEVKKEVEREKEKPKTKEKVQKEERVKSESDEESRDTYADEESEEIESKYPWQTGKHGFSWSKYLEHCKAKAAPQKLFKDAFPYGKNLFKVGMKLEGIDPEHPSRYCILTVFEVVGYRIRLHFDGYPENFDFWVNADSMDIFPVGWSEKNGHKLNPPKGYVPTNFNWNAYLKTCKATPAPKTAFSSKSAVFPPTSFRVGMKLEAVDRKHSSLVCVASIAGLMDSRILVHFDSWDEVYDYWADASSPYIHPVGWCQQNGHNLTPPNNYKDSKSFTWDSYLRETRSSAAPARAFKQRPPCGFKRGMKLEAVDKRVPQLIRVATVDDVKDHMIKIRFDGWPDAHAYWVDDDSSDIHPVGWCNKTGHPLEAPLTPEMISEKSECGTPGCRGVGHIKGPKFATHNAPSGCPYSHQNLHKIRIASDRLNVKHEICDFDEESGDKGDGNSWRVRDRGYKVGRYQEERDVKKEREIKREFEEFEKFELQERGSKMKHQQQSDGNSDEEELPPRKRRKRRQVSEEPPALTNSCFGESTSYSSTIPDKQLRNELYQSVYEPGYSPLPDAPHIWAKHSNALNRAVAKQNTNPRRWSNEEVIKFIQSVPNCKEIASIFRKHSIDGEAFLMLTQEDLVSLLGLRLGPAIKLYNSIVLLRRRAT